MQTKLQEKFTKEIDVNEVYLDLLEKGETDKLKNLIRYYHSYTPTYQYVGRKIDWWIKYKSEILGAIGIAQIIFNLKARDDYIGWDIKQQQKKGMHMANNYRFTLKYQIKNLASHVLSLLHKESVKEWKNKYGDRLVMLDTLVSSKKNGTCYKSAGWIYVGTTKGYSQIRPEEFNLNNQNIPKGIFNLYIKETNQKVKFKDWYYQKFILNKKRKIPLSKNFLVYTGDKKLIFVKPLHRYWKKVLLS